MLDHKGLQRPDDVLVARHGSRATLWMLSENGIVRDQPSPETLMTMSDTPMLEIIAESVHPEYREVARTYTQHGDAEIVELLQELAEGDLGRSVVDRHEDRRRRGPARGPALHPRAVAARAP